MSQFRSPKDAVRCSKSLSFVLRHGAHKKGIHIRSDGFAPLSEIMALPEFRNYSFDDIVYVVENNDKKRFTLQDEVKEGSSKPVWWIKANQGHSLVMDDLELDKIEDSKEIPIVIHGTTKNNWKLIKNSGFISRMNRNHIHCASGKKVSEEAVSGLRWNCEVIFQF